MTKVQKIIEDVKKRGDKAVQKYTALFDGAEVKKFKVSSRDIKRAYKNTDKETISALKKASSNIREFAKKQFRNFKDFEYSKRGVVLCIERGRITFEQEISHFQ